MPASIRLSIQRNPLVAFFILAYALTWTGSLIYYFASPDGGIKLPRLLNLPGSIIWYYGPCLAAVIVTAVTAGKTGLHNLFRRILLWRVGWGWYVFILLFPLALNFLVSGLNWLLGGPALRFFEAEGVPEGNLWLVLLVLVLVQIFLRGIGEETGWRGFALPRLQSRHSALVSSLILGFFWALWHFHPANFSALLSVTGILIALHIISATILFTWLYNHTHGSILIAILFHCTSNMVDFIVPLGIANTSLTVQLIQLVLLWLVIAVLLLREGPQLGNQKLSAGILQ